MSFESAVMQLGSSLTDSDRAQRSSVLTVNVGSSSLHDLPRVAKIIPIPRRYEAAGIRRYGFHGLSYAYLMEELARVAGPDAARGSVILAHLGSGASLAAVREGRCIGINLDERRNTAGTPLVSIDGSRVAVRVIPTDEESMIARASAGLIARTRSGSDRDS